MEAILSKDAASNDKAVKRLRRRPGEPQREQKEATRKKLLAAARATFERFSYINSSVEMIAEAAGVSRTTFYRHFDGKLPVAIALFDVMRPQLQGQWAQLLQNEKPSVPDVVEWINKHVQLVEDNRRFLSVLHELEGLEKDLQPHIFAYEQELLKLIWRSKDGKDSPISDEVMSKSLLLLLQFDQFLHLFTVRNWGIDRPSLIAAMAKILHEFLLFRALELKRLA